MKVKFMSLKECIDNCREKEDTVFYANTYFWLKKLQDIDTVLEENRITMTGEEG